MCVNTLDTSSHNYRHGLKDNEMTDRHGLKGNEMTEFPPPKKKKIANN